MCYTSAAAARTGAKEALANGVLILLVPPMVFFAVIAVVVYMYRNKYRETPVVISPLPVAGSPWFADPDAAFKISREEGLKLAAELSFLEKDSGLLAKDNGLRTRDKQFPR